MGCGTSRVEKPVENLRVPAKSSSRHGHRERLITEWQSCDVTSRYELGDDIGEGSIGSVSVVTRKDGSSAPCRRRFAMKTMSSFRVSREQMAEFENEVRLLRRLDHPHIIQILEWYPSRDRQVYIMELCSLGTLASLAPSTEPVAARLAVQLLQALAYLHDRGVCHGDLKLENLLLHPGPDNKAVLKLIDFGLSRSMAEVSDGGSASSSNSSHPGPEQALTTGTLYTMAPEVLLRHAFSAKADMWSVGVVVFVLLTVTYPFLKEQSDVQDKAAMRRFRHADLRWDSGRAVSEPCEALVRQLLSKDPSNRPTAAQALMYARRRWLPHVLAEEDAASVDADSGTTSRASESRATFLRGLRAFAGLTPSEQGMLRAVAFWTAGCGCGRVDLARLFADLDLRDEGMVKRSALHHLLGHYGATDDADRLFDALDPDRLGHAGFNSIVAACVLSPWQDGVEGGDRAWPCEQDLRWAFTAMAGGARHLLPDGSQEAAGERVMDSDSFVRAVRHAISRGRQQTAAELLGGAGSSRGEAAMLSDDAADQDGCSLCWLTGAHRAGQSSADDQAASTADPVDVTLTVTVVEGPSKDGATIGPEALPSGDQVQPSLARSA